jgi:hypothetical protein
MEPYTKEPVWSDNDNDRRMWRAAEVRKLRYPATRCAGRRRIVRHGSKSPIVGENDFPTTWDGAAAQSCLGMVGATEIFGMDAVTVTQIDEEPAARCNCTRVNFRKEHALRRHPRGSSHNKMDKAVRQQFRGRRDLNGAPNPNR